MPSRLAYELVDLSETRDIELKIRAAVCEVLTELADGEKC
jgi:hypothetical protein